MGRGPHAKDAELFAPGAVDTLHRACAELSWLLERGYADNSALALVGDRHRLRKRQRVAISRSACGDSDRARRLGRRRPLSQLPGQALAIDGFNCLITVEAALSGGVLLRGRDGALRDLASVHGSYRRVETTEDALQRLVRLIAEHEPAEVIWWLDRPVSNSGRLGAMIEAVTEARTGPTRWSVRLDYDPDQRLREHAGIIASADRAVLDGCSAWVDLPSAVVGRRAAESGAPSPWLVDLSPRHQDAR